jgi:hypothetical protein
MHRNRRILQTIADGLARLLDRVGDVYLRWRMRR